MISTKPTGASPGADPLNNAKVEYRPSTEDAIMNYQLDGYFKIAAIKCKRNSIREDSIPETTSNPIIQRDLKENSKPTEEISTTKSSGGQSVKILKTLSESSNKLASYTLSSDDGEEESRSTQTWSKEYDKKKDNHITQSSTKFPEKKVISQAEGSLTEKLESMREKYKHVCMNRDQLLKKNLALSNALKKTQAQMTVRKKEAQKLVKQAQRESSQWKEFATAAENENTVLIPEVDKLRSQLQLVDPKDLESVKQYQNLVKKLKESQSELGKEREQRKKLQQISAEIEIELEQEKVTAMFNAEALEADFKSKRKSAELYNTSLEQRLEGLELNLNSSKLGLETLKNCCQLKRWLVEQSEKEKNPTELVRHGRRRASISRVSSDSARSFSSNQKTARKDDNSHDELSAALKRIMSQAEKEQTKFRNLYEQYLAATNERDAAVKDLASLQRRAEEELSNYDPQNQDNLSGDEESQPLIGPDFSESRSQMQQLQKSPKRRSSGTLVAKIEILEMEVKQKSRMIQYLERESADQLGNVIYFQDPSRPLKKWEHTRYEIFKGGGVDMGDGLEMGDVSSDADEEQMLGGEREGSSWGALLQPEPESDRSKDDVFSVF